MVCGEGPGEIALLAAAGLLGGQQVEDGPFRVRVGDANGNQVW